MNALNAAGAGRRLRQWVRLGCDHVPVIALLLAITCLALSPAIGAEQVADSFARGQYIAGEHPFTQQAPPVFVNDAVGAGIFYNSGFFGGSTVIGNIEAGYIWDGHDVFDRSGLSLGPAVELQVAGTDVPGAYDFHATMVGHVLAGTGYVAASGTVPAGLSYVGMGMAPVAKLWSGAIATAYSTSTASIGSFDTTPASTIPVYRQFFQGISGTKADVINSSFGYVDPTATETESLAIDALAFQNPTVTFVAAAGNGATNPVSAPGGVYNGITVGSVGGTTFRAPSDFSSRGAVDFYNPTTNTTLSGVRVAVDIAAPGELDFLAAYLGPTGGLTPLTNITQNPSPTDLYFANQDGTSFAAPTVAGGVALMKDAAKGSWWMPETALDSRVIKAVLMATSARTDGWNNGQTTVDGVVRTTQALDYATGAGALDLTTAGLTYITAPTRDLLGTSGGTIGTNGWDLGAVGVGGYSDYTFAATLAAPSELQVSLDWFANGIFDSLSDTGARNAFANLDLQVWSVINGSFNTLVAESASLYNNAEFLRFTLPQGGLYGLRVSLPQMVYDVGSTVTSETYGLSWNMVVVPEPSAAALAAIGAALATVMARRRRS
ncbi:MAG: S8 family serine peptidase [Planctomycetota bacterium]